MGSGVSRLFGGGGGGNKGSRGGGMSMDAEGATFRPKGAAAGAGDDAAPPPYDHATVPLAAPRLAAAADGGAQGSGDKGPVRLLDCAGTAFDRRGAGEWVSEAGAVYTGGHDGQGRFHGEGKLSYPNGDGWRGFFVGGARHGGGVEVVAGVERQGVWEHNIPAPD